MLHFHRSRFLNLCSVGGKHTGYFRIQVLGRNLFPCGRLGLEKRITVIEGDFMPGSLSLFSEVNRHLPFVVIPVLGYTHTLGVNTFRKLIFLVCGFQMQTFPEVLFNKLVWSGHPVKVGIQVLA